MDGQTEGRCVKGVGNDGDTWERGVEGKRRGEKGGKEKRRGETKREG